MTLSLLSVISYLLSLISYLLSLISYLLSLILFYLRMAFIYKKITNGGYNFYIHIHIPHSSWLFGGGRDCVTPSPFPYSAMLFGHYSQTTWQNMEMIQNNLEIYRNLEGAIYTSPVENNYFRPADSVKAGGYFFYAGKTIIGAF